SYWGRTASQDVVAEQLSDQVKHQQLKPYLLGAAQDETPLVCFRVTDTAQQGRPRLLLVGGTTGDAVVSVSVVAQMLAHASQLFDGWEVWGICALDAARLRL